MGDLKVSEAFIDAIYITDYDHTAVTGLSPTCFMVKLSDGTRTVLTVAEIGYGVYKVTDFTPAADTEYITIWAVPGPYTIYAVAKLFKVGGGRVEDIIDALGTDGTTLASHDFNDVVVMRYLHGLHQAAVILFIIPEALASISAHNTAILTQLETLGEVITITQGDALDFPDYPMVNLVVLGSDLGVAAWSTANLADLKGYPGPCVLCVQATTAAYFEMGTDGGNAAAKTAITARANIEGSILGAGWHDKTGLAVGANTISSSATYSTLDMSDADITELWYAYESVNANTDVVLGLIRKVLLDGTGGIDEEGDPVNQCLAFYGPAYSASTLNTLGLAVLHILGHILIMSTTVGQASDIEDLMKKLFGNTRGKFSNTVPLAAFIAGNTGGLGTELPNNISMYDVLGPFSTYTTLNKLSLLAWLGLPNTANHHSFYEYVVAGADTSQYPNVAADVDGSVMERQEYAQDAIDVIDAFHDVATANAVTNAVMSDVIGNKTDAPDFFQETDQSVVAYLKGILAASGLSYMGVCDSGMTPSPTEIVCDDLKGFGDDFFNTDWVMLVNLNVNSVGNAPEGDRPRDITNYVSATGTFTVEAFGANVEAGDVIIVARREFFFIARYALPTPVTNSLAYRLSQYLASGDGDWAGSTPLPSNISIFDILSRTGDPAWPAAAVPGNDVSFAEVIRQLYDMLVIIDEFHDVPAADATANAQMNEILGQKGDTVAAAINATNSLMRYMKGLLGAGWTSESLKAIYDLLDAVLDLTETGGTLSATGGEDSIYLNNAPSGVFEPVVVFIDLTNMQAGDAVTIRETYRIKSGGNLIHFDGRPYADAQPADRKGIFITLQPNRYGVEVTLEQTAGVNRDYDWEVFYNS